MTKDLESKNELQRSLPSSYYTSEEIFVQEKEKIFWREWFCAAREEQIASPGDFLVVEVTGESVLLVRTKEGEIKAHYNVCRHRGARIVPAPGEEERGRVKLNGGVLGANGIRCPYHHWTYALDGKLLNRPHMKEREGLCKEEFSLYPVGVELWGGFIFLNLSPDSSTRATLRGAFGDAMDRVKRYPLQELRTAKRIVYEVEANWKVILEN